MSCVWLRELLYFRIIYFYSMYSKILSLQMDYAISRDIID